MNTFSKYARFIGLGIVVSVSLPAYAEDTGTASDQIYPSTMHRVAKTPAGPRLIATSQTQASAHETKTTKITADVPDPSVTPYMTYDGATSSNTDR